MMVPEALEKGKNSIQTRLDSIRTLGIFRYNESQRKENLFYHLKNLVEYYDDVEDYFPEIKAELRAFVQKVFHVLN